MNVHQRVSSKLHKYGKVDDFERNRHENRTTNNTDIGCEEDIMYTQDQEQS